MLHWNTVLFCLVLLNRAYCDKNEVCKLAGGETCFTDTECASNYCIHITLPAQSRSSHHFQVTSIEGSGYCAKASKQFANFIGEGGFCEANHRCASGFCATMGRFRFCARESPKLGLVGDGGMCVNHEQCYSNFCGTPNGNNPTTSICSAQSRVQGLVGGGGRCAKDRDCYSGYCVQRPGSDWHQRCSSDAPLQGYVGGGGPCQYPKQCYSQRCILHSNQSEFGLEHLPLLYICSKHSPKLGLVGGGGLCESDHHCFAKYCIKQPFGKTGHCAKHTAVRKRVDEGGLCPEDKRCFSDLCVRIGQDNVCAKKSLVLKKVGGGGPCFKDRDCYSHHCTHREAVYGNLTALKNSHKNTKAKICAKDSPTKNLVGGGGACNKHNDCYSKFCAELRTASGRSEWICAAEASEHPRPENWVFDETDPPSAYIRLVEDGGPCNNDKDCASNQCFNAGREGRFCAKRSVKGHDGIGEGGRCNNDDECASGYCATVKFNTSQVTVRICAKESSERGWVGDGGFCERNQQCYSGYCVIQMINLNSSKAIRIAFCAKAGSRQGKVGQGGPCLSHSQCESNRCGRLKLMDKDKAPADIQLTDGKQVCVAKSTEILTVTRDTI